MSTIGLCIVQSPQMRRRILGSKEQSQQERSQKPEARVKPTTESIWNSNGTGRCQYSLDALMDLILCALASEPEGNFDLLKVV